MRTKQDTKTVKRLSMILSTHELLKILQVALPGKATKFSFQMKSGHGMNSTVVSDLDRDINIDITWEEPV